MICFCLRRYFEDGHRPIESGDFEDKEDRIAFGDTDMTKYEYVNQVLPLKHNDDQIDLFSLYNKDSISNEAWARLGGFLKRNTHLRTIVMIHCNLTCAYNIGDEGLEGISTLYFSRLTHLCLANNGIGRQGCMVIANLLRSDESSLGYLGLAGNAIDDACAEILAGSLAKNTKLGILQLHGNDNISCVGWESFRRLVCDTSSLSATYASNHTLFHMDREYYIDSQQLKCGLRDNGKEGTLKDKACRKVIKHHFKKGNNPGPLLDMDAKLMPRVFSWINQRSEDFGDGGRHNFMYQTLRTLNVCAFVPEDIAHLRSTGDVW